jgi:hypothetical protein
MDVCPGLYTHLMSTSKRLHSQQWSGLGAPGMVHEPDISVVSARTLLWHLPISSGNGLGALTFMAPTSVNSGVPVPMLDALYLSICWPIRRDRGSTRSRSPQSAHNTGLT